jgi:ribosomal protein L29
MKYQEIQKKTPAELMRLLKLNREKLRDLRFKIARKQFKNVREVRKIKKMIAQILTRLQSGEQSSAKTGGIINKP